MAQSGKWGKHLDFLTALKKIIVHEHTRRYINSSVMQYVGYRHVALIVTGVLWCTWLLMSVFRFQTQISLCVNNMTFQACFHTLCNTMWVSIFTVHFWTQTIFVCLFHLTFHSTEICCSPYERFPWISHKCETVTQQQGASQMLNYH